jgi:hypothetical protein
MRLYWFLVTLALACIAASAQDMSGVWRWNPGKSKPSAHPPEDMWVRIEQDGQQISITLRSRRAGVEETETARFVVGPNENANQIHGAPMKSFASREGQTLVVKSTAMFGGKELRMTDRWTLSKDGNSLTFEEHHQFGDEPAGDDMVVFDRQPNSEWKPDEKPKPAEEVYKNIQIMKGVPAPRLMTVMGFFTRWLGVECSHCHAGTEFEKDDKPAKQTARKMLLMVRVINKDNFSDRGPVTCWMCHRGSATPESLTK